MVTSARNSRSLPRTEGGRDHDDRYLRARPASDVRRRHLVALGWTVVFATVIGLVLTLVLSLFLDLKSRREEVWLRDRYDGYAAYCRQTPHKLVPFVY